MGKYICLLALMALGLVLTAGCAGTEWEPTPYDNVNIFDGVRMIVKVKTVSSTGLTVVLENKDNVEHYYGEDHLIEKKLKGKWYQVPPINALEFPATAISLLPGESREWDSKWEWHYGTLDAGEYRIIKDILTDIGSQKLAAEFEILSDKE